MTAVRKYKLSDYITVTLPGESKIEKLGVKSGARSHWQDYADVLRARVPFRTSGSLCGAPVKPDELRDGGRLDCKWLADMRRADYVVWSYGTPIAWHILGEGWVIPARGTAGDGVESVTTTAQMNKIRVAVGSFDRYRDTVA